MKNNKPNCQETIYQMFAERPIAYNAGLAKVLGSVNAALLLAQLLYWQGKGSKGDWTYKTMADMEAETGLSKSNQQTAIQLCKAKGILEVRRKGVPATRLFKVDIRRLISLIISLQESGKLDRPKPADRTAEYQPTTTESTAEIIRDSPEGLKKLRQIKAISGMRSI